MFKLLPVSRYSNTAFMGSFCKNFLSTHFSSYPALSCSLLFSVAEFSHHLQGSVVGVRVVGELLTPGCSGWSECV